MHNNQLTKFLKMKQLGLGSQYELALAYHIVQDIVPTLLSTSFRSRNFS